MKDYQVTEEEMRLNALADGELSSEESELLLSSIEDDVELRTDLCDIHRVKDMMHYAYADAKTPLNRHQSKFSSRMNLSIAASVLLTVGALLGAMVNSFTTESIIVPFSLAQVDKQAEKVVLYVGFSDKKKFEDALVKAEYLLETYADQGVEVNVVTSAGGIDMLRESDSPYTRKVKELADNYSALSFIACNNTLARLKAQGETVDLISNVKVAPSAVQFVVGRLEEGWSYVPI